MNQHSRAMPDVVLRRVLQRIAPADGGLELLASEDCDERGCAAVRSIRSGRVYLFVQDGEPRFAAWRPVCEIIGFEGLRPQLRASVKARRAA